MKKSGRRRRRERGEEIRVNTEGRGR
jgi:hypothetical protein